MRIGFTYEGKPRTGELLKFHVAGTGSQLATVKEDGGAIKTFYVSRMDDLTSNPAPSEEELTALVRGAAERKSREMAQDPINPLQVTLISLYKVPDSALTAERARAAYEFYKTEKANGLL